MSNATCSNCGAALVSGAKFCRQCGRLAGGHEAPSATEATTRTLRPPAEYGAQPTDYFSPQPTSPAYLAPSASQPPPAYNTSTLAPVGQKRNNWLIALLASLVLISLVALGIVLLTKSQTAATPTPPAQTRPKSGTIPEPPPPPPPPPDGESSDDTPGSKRINSAYIYPGAETLMDMTNRSGGGFLQLRSKDSYQKVLDWYTNKLKPESIIKSPGPSAVLKSEGIMAVLNGSGEGTNIMLKYLGEGDVEEER